MAVSMGTPKSCSILYLEIGKKLSANDLTSGSVKLFNKGKTSVLKKLAEEAAEVWAAVRFEKPEDLALELSQVWYYLILLSFFYPDQQQEFSEFLAETDSQLPSTSETGNLPKSLIHTCVELTCDDRFLSHSKTLFGLTGEIARLNQVSLADIHSHL